MKKALILTDGKAGHENQSKALARQLGCDFNVAEVHFKSKRAKALSYALDHLGIHTLSLFEGFDASALVREEYAVVLGTGSGTFYAAKTLAKKWGVTCGVVLYPRGYRLATFDCILAPSFDRPKKAPNVIELAANLVANDAAFYEQGVAAFRQRHDQRCDAIAVIVGGPNKCSTMTEAWMENELVRIFKENPGCEKWVTTSRRTPLEVERLIDLYAWDYKLLYSKDHFNPIPAFVKLAKRLYVSAESTGMLSEACTFGAAEVVALDNLKAGDHKFRRFVDSLRAAGYVEGNRKIDLTSVIAAARGLLKL